MSSGPSTPEAPAVRDVEAEREQILAYTAEWLGRTTTMLNTVVAEFPNTYLRSNDRGSGKVVTGKMFTTPRIVLPARPVASFASKVPKFERRTAVSLDFEYDIDGYKEKTKDGPIRIGDLPVPDEIHIMSPHVIALPSDEGERYRYSDNVSISDEKLDLFPWIADGFGATLPHRWGAYGQEDELVNFNTFRDYPIEALREKPLAIDYHRTRLENFIGALVVVSAALEDETLNPRQ